MRIFAIIVGLSKYPIDSVAMVLVLCFLLFPTYFPASFILHRSCLYPGLPKCPIVDDYSRDLLEVHARVFFPT